jgi:triacylglycerol lipase
MAALAAFLVLVAGAVAGTAAIQAASTSSGPASRAGPGGQNAGRVSPGTGGQGPSAADPSPGASGPATGASSPGTGASSPGAGASPVPQNRPGPVLLVPGYGGDSIDLVGLAARINASGRTATVVNLPGNGTENLAADAHALGAAVNRALRKGAPSVDVIGYSAGGVAALIWARDDGGAARARRVITLGAPFHGTAVAAAAHAFTPSLCATACRQLVPGSRLLSQLDAAPAPPGPHWLSIWSTDDLVVTPAASARLPGALDVPIQSVCPGRQINHLQLPTDPVVAAIVLRAIGTAPLRYPTTAICHA